MTATTKFYTGFFIVLALIVAIAFYAGYRAGSAHDRAAVHRTSVPRP